jgi:hypothetical protein
MIFTASFDITKPTTETQRHGEDPKDLTQRTRRKTSPLINTDNTDQEKTKPLKRGGTEAAEKPKNLTTKDHKGARRRIEIGYQKIYRGFTPMIADLKQTS